MYVCQRNLGGKKSINVYIGRKDEKKKRPKKRKSHYISPIPIIIIKNVMDFTLQF